MNTTLEFEDPTINMNYELMKIKVKGLLKLKLKYNKANFLKKIWMRCNCQYKGLFIYDGEDLIIEYLEMMRKYLVTCKTK